MIKNSKDKILLNLENIPYLSTYRLCLRSCKSNAVV